MVKLVKSIIVTALAFETIGLILNFIVFIQDYPFWQALGISAFHTVSSFNNAGFDIIGSTSFMAYANDPLFNFTTTMLIICGGIGFIVIHDILVKRNWKNLTNYTKIVLRTTAVLLVGGTLYLKAVEGSDISWFQAFFQSVTPRTAGFYTADLTAFAIPSIAGLVLLMFIGASPNSTGGGIKTTTAYTMFKSTISFLRGKTPVLKNRKIDDETRIKAFTITFLSAVVIFAAFVAVTAIERDSTAFEPTGTNILFEIVSAIGTVGLSLNVTPFLTPASKIVVSIIMFVGRLGPITIFGMWNRNWGHPYASTVDYAAEKILIG
jgi:trk system potassium uptake protein TrkH